MTATSGNLILVGASVRAAAWSVLRAGLEPWCVDLFADRDLRRLATARVVAQADYPNGLVRALDDAPAAPFLFTGALENRPRLIERLARRLPLWGNGPEVLRRVRSPFLAAESLQRAGIPCPAVRRLPPGRDTRRWLLKPRFGAGGRGIAFWDDHTPKGRPGLTRYFQEWIEGDPCAAVYLAGNDGQAHLVGVTRQLIGVSWLNAGPFQYCGSAGPMLLTQPLAEQYRRIGDTLAHDFALRGLFGVDCVVRDGIPLPVEINPRYTASMEILEWAFGQPLLARHAEVFGFKAAEERGISTSGILAKAVVYAGRPEVFPRDGPWCETLAGSWQPWIMPEFADIPSAGQRFLRGEPILSVYARGKDMSECVEILRRKAAMLTAAAQKACC